MDPEGARLKPIECTRCSIELPEEATFCWRCGHVRRSGMTAADGTVRYETCEITYGRSAKTGKVVFVASATGDGGTYPAGESEPLKWDAMTYLGAGSPAALDRLLAQLVAQGWVSLGKHGFYYWAQRLRRQLATEARADIRAGRRVLAGGDVRRVPRGAASRARDVVTPAPLPAIAHPADGRRPAGGLDRHQEGLLARQCPAVPHDPRHRR